MAAADSCPQCNRVVELDASFCNHCGHRLVPEERSFSGGAEPDSDHSYVREPSLYLAVFSFFGQRWQDVHVAMVAILMVPKGFIFVYPDGWRLTEVALLALAYGLRRLQRVLSSYGERAQNAGAVAASLALSAPVVLLFGYFTKLQVYVLQLEFVAGALSLALLTPELMLAAVGGMLLVQAGSNLQKGVVAISVLLSAASVVLVGVALFSGVPSHERLHVTLIIGLSFAAGSVPVALVALFLMLDL